MDINGTIKRNRIEVKSPANPKNGKGEVRFSINSKGIFRLLICALRKITKQIDTEEALAMEIRKTGFHEARLLAGFMDDQKLMIIGKMETWVMDFDSWEVFN
jgi:3-methyladenine DNA glycosylase AlkD